MPGKTSPTHSSPNNSPTNAVQEQQRSLDQVPPSVPMHDRIYWAWPGWLPAGFLTILASAPGVGKSFTALRIAASFLDDRPWPDGTPFTGRKDTIVWLEGESGHRMHRQRLRAMRLDPDEITFLIEEVRGNFELANPEHREALWDAAGSHISLLVLDSLTGLRGHGRHARATFEFVPELVDLAWEFGIPVLVTHHLHRRPNLDRGGQPDLERLLGSPILARVARVVWVLDAPDPADPGNRRLSMVKNNLAPLANPIGLRIDAQGPHFGPPPQPSLPPAAAQSEEDRAVDLLKDLLAQGPLPATQIFAAAQDAAISIPTLKRAKTRLRVKSNKLPNQWTWELPPE